ncbi:hypothetical protein HJC23_012976 [Cyclotella cryptica]|uniref:Methyltransferase FkbM domain-containing protein n=1 Tax=Cyclotella cryptica TaxID=29204 RepID=A0ABD3QI98_9STRA
MDAAVNLRMFNDPRDVKFKPNVQKQRHTSATSCQPVDVQELESQHLFKAQDNEDRCLVQYFFAGMCHGQYLDIGALDGVQLSISHAFYSSPLLNWKGVNVELDPDNYDKLTRNRRGDMANIHAAVCSDSQTVHFALAKDKTSGGIWEFTSQSYRNHWWPNMTIFQAIPMKCTPIQRILDQNVKCDNMYFDLMSIDLNGAEYSALLGLDFDKVGFGVIIVARNDRDDINWRVDDLLRSKGYNKVTDNPCKNLNNRNVWYIDREFEKVYHNLIIQQQNNLLRGN